MKNESVDVIKGFIIALIVLIHLLFLVPKTNASGQSSIFIQFLYTGIMIFFIFSGYYYRSIRSALSNIKKRLIQIGIPLVLGLSILPLLLLGYLFILGQDPDPNGYWYCLQRIFGSEGMFQPFVYEDIPNPVINVYNGYYFLQIMIVAFLIFYPLVEHVLDDIRKTIASAILLCLCTALMMQYLPWQLPFWAHYGPLAAAFMLFGAVLGKKDFIDWLEKYEFRDKKYWLYLLVPLVASIAMILVFPPGTSFENNVIGNYGGWSAFPYFITCCLTCVFFLFVATWFVKIPVISKVFSTMGKHTLAILCLHIFVLKLMIAPFHDLVVGATFPKLPISEVIVFWILSLIICTAIAIYVPKLIGKVKEKYCSAQ